MSTSKTHDAHSIFIKLKRSPIGTNKNIRLILKGLGLRRMQQVVQRPDTEQVRGLVNKVKHLVEVTHA